MKRNNVLALAGIMLGMMVASCGSENNTDRYDDSVYADTSYIDLDSNGVMDTAGRQDSTYMGSPTTGNGSGTGNTNQRN